MTAVVRPGDPGWWLVVTVTAAIGLVIGSFLNVVIWRVPRGESVVAPRSRCPVCGHEIRFWENVPVLSWIILRRRCSQCRAPISVRYPLVESVTAMLMVAVVWKFGISWVALAFCYLAAVGVALTCIDLAAHKLPNVLVLPSYPVLIVLLGAQSWVDGDFWSLGRAAVGGMALYAFYFLAMVVYPGGMGFGDVKLAGVLGFALAWLGWAEFAIGAFAAFLLGGMFAIALLVARRASKGSGIPFGPWMIAGASLGIAVGAPLWHWYLGVLT